MSEMISLPFDLNKFIAHWASLRREMLKSGPPTEFTRDEWAYVIGFLSEENLLRPFRESFGKDFNKPTKQPARLWRPRGPVALWLPNNVSLLGPLTLILMSLTGNRQMIKSGSRSTDMAGSFLEYARTKIKSGPLADYLKNQITVVHASHDDPRLQEFSQAKVRIVFGSDHAAAAVQHAAHPLDSVGFSFSDRRSQAWIEPKAITPALIQTLLKVFSIYGQAGCTSPQKVVIIDGREKDAAALRDELIKAWPKVIKQDQAMHISSENIMLGQWSRANGWSAKLTEANGALFAAGKMGLEDILGQRALGIVPATLEEAARNLPDNIQTIGYGLKKPRDKRYLDVIAKSGIKRFVPLAEMHHFGGVWDGWSFWQQAFEPVSLSI